MDNEIKRHKNLWNRKQNERNCWKPSIFVNIEALQIWIFVLLEKKRNYSWYDRVFCVGCLSSSRKNKDRYDTDWCICWFIKILWQFSFMLWKIYYNFLKIWRWMFINKCVLIRLVISMTWKSHSKEIRTQINNTFNQFFWHSLNSY